MEETIGHCRDALRSERERDREAVRMDEHMESTCIHSIPFILLNPCFVLSAEGEGCVKW